MCAFQLFAKYRSTLPAATAGATTAYVIQTATASQIANGVVEVFANGVLISDDLYENGRIDLEKLQPIGRLAGANGYCRISDRFEIERKINPDK